MDQPGQTQMCFRFATSATPRSTSTTDPDRTTKYHSRPYRQIGTGRCSIVWAGGWSPYVIKCDKIFGKTAGSRGVVDEALTYTTAEKTVTSLRALTPYHFCAFHIPQLTNTVHRHDHAWWNVHRGRFPNDHLQRSALVMERILPFESKIRDNLIVAFFPESKYQAMFHDPANDCCLIRPYLGKKTGEEPRTDSICDMALCIDEMRQYDLPVDSYAQGMAEALAMMLWSVNSDAARVDFVLSPSKGHHHPSSTFDSVMLGRHSLWLFDFEEVRHMDVYQDPCKLQMAVDAFFDNASYYPNPAADNTADQQLWEGFKMRFITSSRLILGDNPFLAWTFLRMVEQRASSSSTSTATEPKINRTETQYSLSQSSRACRLI